MIKLVQMTNAGVAGKFRNLFKAREIFFHDGTSLRRLTIGSRVQFALAVTALSLLLWSIFAAAQLAIVAAGPSQADIARMEREMESMQADVLTIKKVAQARYHLTAREVRRLGLDPDRLQEGVGGPLEAVPATRVADPNFKALFMSWKRLEKLEQGTIAIPSTEPVHGTAFTSGYGVRSDPFRGRAAMHAGIDLAGPIGTPIYATADGFVGRSQWVNGYGNLVELDHGRGIQTRYGHLSKSLVQEGQRVKRGDMIALMGSTGRSTGSHLHYEVRLDGKAVNPVPFMQSSNYLQSVQRRAAASTPIAIGGPEAGTR
ncbi:M23 family metallopeptidase [Sphingosinicella rhizophila]|uniref:M23 family metallopeptidase n=1 Tax=Sphingosinicella rhizophila TaxID=3050082 RepID=A0ABU3Q3T2_9SPHN|nr:M23 family metallopeptidase [Sphingosinicella sp. GR2756]MDT9598071.1 M23 family metallopeptidase [Sphingosinicella sp. GR2756]